MGPVRRVATTVALASVDLVQHQVNHDAGYRYIEPEGESPAGDGAVAVETLAQGAAESDDHHRDNDSGEDGMSGQDAEVERSHPSGALKVHRSDMRVVVEIGNQE